jgi:hypothetical protein
VAGIAESKLYENFPAGDLNIEPISDVRRSLRRILARSRRPKRMPPLDAVLRMPRQRQQEYYVWLAGVKPNERVFRYGCDRYFNRLNKKRKVPKTKPKKRRPFPYWLEPFWFGHHPHGCLCKACGGPGKNHRNSSQLMS